MISKPNLAGDVRLFISQKHGTGLKKAAKRYVVKANMQYDLSFFDKSDTSLPDNECSLKDGLLSTRRLFIMNIKEIATDSPNGAHSDLESPLHGAATSE